MYYSSESSDSDNVRDKKSLDLSYLMLDSESLASYLKSSVREQNAPEAKHSINQPTDESLTGLHAKDVSPFCQFNLHSEEDEDDADDLVLQLEKSKLAHKMESLSSEAAGFVFQDNTCLDGSALSAAQQFHAIRIAVSQSRNVSESENENEGTASQDDVTEQLYLNHNIIIHIPFELVLFHKLKFLDLSNNNLSQLNDFILQLPELHTLYVKNNQLDDNCFPKDLSLLTKIREINISGNLLTTVPQQLYEVISLRYLYLGNNNITEISPAVKALQK